jgi:hypothetical protein
MRIIGTKPVIHTKLASQLESRKNITWAARLFVPRLLALWHLIVSINYVI